MDISTEFEKGNIPKCLEIYDSFLVTNHKIKNYEKILCSISGGSDSDIMMDLFCRINKDKVKFVFFDTGLEYQATKDHLKELEDKYNIEIAWIRAKKPIPITCKEYGQPFLSKQVSEWIERLQRHNFKWVDKSFSELYKEYPKCKAALRWWCDEFGEDSKFNIRYNKGLKEFMISNPPKFKISPKCCKYAKKDPVHEFIKDNDFDLNCYGVRKAEGGARSTAYKNCFTNNAESGAIDEYRPIFWYKDSTKKIYEEHFRVAHSKCYSEYGLKRTGCAGCPFNKEFEEELKIIYNNEPKLFKAVTNIFKDSYDYTRRYREFVNQNFRSSDKDVLEGQISMLDCKSIEGFYLGDQFVNDCNGIVATIIKIDKDSILVDQARDNEKFSNLQLNFNWLSHLIEDGTLRRLSS
ncbi:phosphoadenosine phosphosulfate reductase family protein [Clostridium botulinum]|uniref:phosphoadenosine phosphosulfate reductase domain-containing protein n=1 Tax=Clostridium botulinum TaxID=1491 RepID=UPI000AE8EE60|nr:phosphoadenosine phosphosulfate reductase family protein [Clostridium botulinum]